MAEWLTIANKQTNKQTNKQNLLLGLPEVKRQDFTKKLNT